MDLNWGDNRQARWVALCASMLGGDRYVSSLTALLNLDWRNSTEQKDVPQRDIVAGLNRYVWPLLGRIRPRIVCPLTDRVWDCVAEKVESLRVAFQSCPVSLPRTPIVFQFSDCDFLTLLVKPRNHRSRALSYTEISEVGKACAWFLRRTKPGSGRSGPPDYLAYFPSSNKWRSCQRHRVELAALTMSSL